jgi:hypothetical protein
MDDASQAGRVERPDAKSEAEWIGLAERVVRERRDANATAGADGANYWTGFDVEQWVPSAALAQVYDKAQSIDAGFGVEEWRLHPFISTTDVFTNAPLTSVFAGMQVDLAVRDTDAWLNRVSYHITLLGKIVFAPIVIT